MSEYISKIIASQDFVNQAVDTVKTEINNYVDEEIIKVTEESANNTLETAKSYTDTSIANLIGTAPETRNTIEELAKAIADHEEVTDALDAAITNKANASDLTAHSSNKSNPHSVTASQLGLSYETWTFTLDDNSTVTKKVVVM